MTSTLPNFPASPVAASAVGTGILNSAHLPGQTADAGAHGASAGILTEFAALLAGGRTPAASVTGGITAPPVAITGAGTASGATPNLVIPGEGVAANVTVAQPENTPARPHGISREEYEHAAAFVAALLQSLQAVAPVPTEPVATQTVAGLAPSSEGVGGLAESTGAVTSAPTSLVLPNGRPFPTDLPSQAKPGFTQQPTHTMMPAVVEEPVVAPLTEAETPTNLVLPNGREFPTALPPQAKPSFERSPVADQVAPAASPVPASMANTGVATPVAHESLAATPLFEISSDGAIECTVPQAAQPGSSPALVPDASMEVHAELELPGRAVVRVSAEIQMSPEGATERPENFAALTHGKSGPEKMSGEAVERNFVSAGDKQVKTGSSSDGIAVAKTENTMPVVPTEETRQPRNPEISSALPVRADFQVVSPTAERITVEPAAPAGQNFAERAVATVTGLAEAQFSASMHRAGSVQLRLKFGGEDLTVRVELREGVVHTDFRTDSPALREALAKEWQAVAAAAPGQLQRFLDPVFSPASSSGSLSDSGAQQHPAHRQAQQQEQQAQRAEAWASASPFSRRSALSESFVPEPAAPRVPVLLPTSLRLSALA